MNRTPHAFATDYASRLVQKKTALARQFDPEKTGEAIARRAVELMQSIQSQEATRFQNFRSLQGSADRHSDTITIEATCRNLLVGASIPWFEQGRFKKNPWGRISNLRFHLIRMLFGHERMVDHYARRLCFLLAEHEAEMHHRRKWGLPAMVVSLAERREIEAISAPAPTSTMATKSL